MPLPSGAGAGKLFVAGNFEQGVPVIGRIHLRRQQRIFRREGLQGDAGGSRPQENRIGIHQAVASHPDAELGVRQFRQDEPAIVIGHDDFHEVSRGVIGFRYDPNAGFGAAGAFDRTLDHAFICRLRRDWKCGRGEVQDCKKRSSYRENHVLLHY